MALRIGTRAFLAILLSVVAYLAVVAWAAGHLTFYWDDYFLIRAQMDLSLVDVLRAGVNGNWWPVASVILYAETFVFGSSYVGYLLVNAVLLLVVGILMVVLVRPLLGRAHWYAVVLAVIYVTSLGVVINATVVTVSWPLSVMFALAAAVVWRDRGRTWLWLLLLTLSFLSQSGMFAANAAIAASLVLATRLLGPEPAVIASRDYATALGVMIAGAIGTGVGYLVASSLPINETLGGSGGGLGSMLDGLTIQGAGQSVFAFLTAWLGMPVIPASLTLPGLYPWLYVLVASHLLVFLAMWAIALLCGWAWTRRNPTRLSRQRWIALAVALIALTEVAFILAVARPGIGLSPRYALLWLIPSLTGWSILVAEASSGPALGRISLIPRLLIVASAVVGVLMLPVTLRTSIDVDRDRWQESSVQLTNADNCRSGGVPRSSDVVAPSISPDDFCRIIRYLDDRKVG